MSLVPIFNPKPPPAYDLSNIVATNSGTLTDGRGNVHFTPDGSRLLGFTATKGRWTYADCSTAWDPSTVGSATTVDCTPNEASVTQNSSGIRFNADGSKVFLTYRGTNEYIEEYALSGAYQGTPTYQAVIDAGFGNAIDALDFNADGTLLVILQGANFYSYTLSTGFDLSTAGAKSSSLLSVTNAVAFSFAKNGTRLLVGVNPSGISNDYFSMSTLLTPYDVSTAGTFTDSSTFNGLDSVQFKSDGKEVFKSFNGLVQGYTSVG